ncbi:phosphohistidine phosphatase SixA, partial [bacterium]|nr:phosphohistidine phosphatase SixA [bacterium]
MKLYLVQHGEAAPKEVNRERSLTRKGKKDVFRMAKFLKKAGIKVIATWHSEKLRAIQTAQILGEAISVEIVKQDGLAPDDPVDKWLEELNTRVKDVMMVGHLPFLERLASLLLAGDESSQIVAFEPGAVVCLKREDAGEKWSLAWI